MDHQALVLPKLIDALALGIKFVPTVIPPLNVTAVLVVAPRLVTVDRVLLTPIVTAPVADDTVISVPATALVTPELVIVIVWAAADVVIPVPPAMVKL